MMITGPRVWRLGSLRPGEPTIQIAHPRPCHGHRQRQHHREEVRRSPVHLMHRLAGELVELLEALVALYPTQADRRVPTVELAGRMCLPWHLRPSFVP